MHTIIIGAGIWGLTMARLIAEKRGEPVIVVEKRSAPGGNSRSFFDDATGIECHEYGSHIFHLSNPEVWRFLSRFTSLTGYRHKVLATHKRKVYAMPINLFTINALYGRNFTPEEAKKFIKAEAARAGIDKPANLEEKAVSQIGRPLYEAFIKNYTAKQWEKDPSQLSPEVITRLPVRFSYDMSYFSDVWQGVPEAGFGDMFARMLDHPNIRLRLNCDYQKIRNEIPEGARVIYTGQPDALFDYKYGPLEWRSLRFEWETINVADFQGTTVMNYSDADALFTRIHEFKHYNPERREIFEQDRTVICREYPAPWQPGAEAYYPLRSDDSLKRYALYAAEAKKTGIILGGRLGRFKYLDMDKAILDAMRVFDEEIEIF